MLVEIAMRRMSHRRVGLTLIELVVVMGVIAILGAILMSAVQRMREAARRVTCANHLKQFGLAILEHHESVGRFPISVGPFEETPTEGRHPHTFDRTSNSPPGNSKILFARLAESKVAPVAVRLIEKTGMHPIDTPSW